ncbi:MAG: cyclase family protein [Nocardioidaceae bacterium]
MPVNSGTVVYPGDPIPRFEVHSTIETQGFNLLQIHLGSQSGTHVDAPYHFEEDGLRIDELPVHCFVGPGVVVDARGLEARAEITWEHVAPVAGQIARGVVVLLRTGWSEHYGNERYFEHPFLTADACRRMLDLGARTFCIDAINIDETPDAEHPGVGFPCHHLISRLDGVIGENFQLSELPDGDFLIACTPLRLTGADGGPVRAVAIQLSS